jgi:predicted Na+-dependent transporter
MQQEYRIGVLLAAIAPSGIMALVLSRFIRLKDDNLILGNFLASQFGCIIYIPLVIKILVGTSVSVNSVHLFLQICALILVPYALSVAAKKIKANYSFRGSKYYSQVLASVLIFFIISLSISGVSVELEWEKSLIALTPIVFLLFVIQGGLAYLFGGIFWDKKIRNSLALGASSRNTVVMIGIGAINFSPVVVVPCVLGLIFHHLTNAFWLWFLDR